MKKLTFTILLTLFVLSLILIGVSIGWFSYKLYGNKLLGNDDNYDFEMPKPSINNLPKNLSIHLCSSECIYEIKLVDEYKINDSFIINNQLNASNCIKCDKYLVNK